MELVSMAQSPFFDQDKLFYHFQLVLTVYYWFDTQKLKIAFYDFRFFIGFMCSIAI